MSKTKSLIDNKKHIISFIVRLFLFNCFKQNISLDKQYKIKN